MAYQSGYTGAQVDNAVSIATTVGATNGLIRSDGNNNISEGTVDLTGEVTGVLPTGYGGTGNSNGYIRTGAVGVVGNYSTVEGGSNIVSGTYGHAEGRNNSILSGMASHIEGRYNQINGDFAHAEGYYTVAGADGAHAQNIRTAAMSDAQTALGKYNIADMDDTYAVIVGNGTANDARSNALTLDWSGNAVIAGHLTDGDGNVYIMATDADIQNIIDNY